MVWRTPLTGVLERVCHEHLARQVPDLVLREKLTPDYRLGCKRMLLSDDYYQSDKDWMDLDATIEVTIGPYETYEDELLGLKGAFEAFVTVADAAASADLKRFKGRLADMERHLPVGDELKTTRGGESPIRVVDLVFSAGDARKSVQTIAFNLPNDERVRAEKGAKKVLLRNLIAAKFETIMRPIGERALAWVRKYLDEARSGWLVDPTETAFCLTQEGQRVSLERMSAMVRGYVKQSGIDKAGACHLFRHAAATAMLDNGADIRYVQSMLGHASIATTQVYTHVSIETLKAIHAATHPGAKLKRDQDKDKES